MRYLALTLAALALLAGGCRRTEFTGDDAKMMRAAKVIAKAVNEYHIEYAEWPESLQGASPFLPSWPVNPYDGKPVADTGSPDFDAATSVGMVYYEKFYREERLMNYQLHVFGDKGKLYIIGSTVFGVKE